MLPNCFLFDMVKSLFFAINVKSICSPLISFEDDLMPLLMVIGGVSNTVRIFGDSFTLATLLVV